MSAFPEDPMVMPPDITQVAAASDWMLARMREGHSVVDPLISNVVLPNGFIVLTHDEWEISEPEPEHEEDDDEPLPDGTPQPF